MFEKVENSRTSQLTSVLRTPESSTPKRSLALAPFSVASPWCRSYPSYPSPEMSPFGLLALAALILSWTLLTEVVQSSSSVGNFFLMYCIRSSFSFALVPWAVLRWHRTGVLFGCKLCGPPAPGARVPLGQLLLLALALSPLGAFVSLSWYASLHTTLASVNNAIYQSSSAIVFVVSVFLLGERVSLQKVFAVAISVGGVAVVSFAPSSSAPDASSSTPTLSGYLWLLGSILGYSFYEVLFARFSQLEVVRIADICARFTSEHAAAEGNDAAADAATSKAAVVGTGAPSSTGGNEWAPATREYARDAEGGSAVGGGAGTAAAPAATTATAHASSGANALYKVEMSACFLGSLGAWTLLTLWPLFFVLDRAGVEPFELPDADSAKKIAISCAFDIVFNMSLLSTIALVSPLWSALGSVLVIPSTMLADWVIHHVVLSPQAGGGIILILLGFVLLQVPPRYMEPLEDAVMCRRAMAGHSHGAGGAPDNLKADRDADSTEAQARALLAAAY